MNELNKVDNMGDMNQETETHESHILHFDVSMSGCGNISRCPMNDAYMIVEDVFFLKAGTWTDSSAQVPLKHKMKTIQQYAYIFEDADLVNDHFNNNVIGRVYNVRPKDTGAICNLVVYDEFAQREIQNGKLGLSIRAHVEIDTRNNEVTKYSYPVNVSLVETPACEVCKIVPKNVKQYAKEMIAMSDTQEPAKDPKIEDSIATEFSQDEFKQELLAEMSKLFNTKLDELGLDKLTKSVSDTIYTQVKQDMERELNNVLETEVKDVPEGDIMTDNDLLTKIDELITSKLETFKAEPGLPEDGPGEGDGEGPVPEAEITATPEITMSATEIEMQKFMQEYRDAQAREAENKRNELIVELAKYGVYTEEQARDMNTETLEVAVEMSKYSDSKITEERKKAAGQFIEPKSSDELEVMMSSKSEIDMVTEMMTDFIHNGGFRRTI